MQLSLRGLAQTAPDEKTTTPNVWLTLEAEQRNEALGVLSRLLIKLATAEVVSVATIAPEKCDDA